MLIEELISDFKQDNIGNTKGGDKYEKNMDNTRCRCSGRKGNSLWRNESKQP